MKRERNVEVELRLNKNDVGESKSLKLKETPRK